MSDQETRDADSIVAAASDKSSTGSNGLSALFSEVFASIRENARRIGLLESARTTDVARLDKVERAILHLDSTVRQTVQDAMKTEMVQINHTLADLKQGRDENRTSIEAAAKNISQMADAQQAQQKAQERRLLIAEGALATYVAGERHRRDRQTRIERAVYTVGTAMVTPLWLFLLETFLARTHSVTTAGNDILSLGVLGVMLVVAIWLGYKATTLPGPPPSGGPGSGPGPGPGPGPQNIPPLGP